MNALALIIGLIIGIGIVVVVVPLFWIGIEIWYCTIPIIAALLFGWLGFFFGIGLDVIICVIKAIIE